MSAGAPTPHDTRDPDGVADQKHVPNRLAITLLVVTVGAVAALAFYHLGQTGTPTQIAAATAWAEFMVAVTAGVGIWISLLERAPAADKASLAILDWLKAHSSGPELPPPTGVPARLPDTAPPEDKSTVGAQEDDRPP